MSDNIISTIASVFGIASFAAAAVWLNNVQVAAQDDVVHTSTNTITTMNKRVRRPKIGSLPAQEEETVTVTETKTVTKRVRRPQIAPVAQDVQIAQKPTEYSPEEVALMNDYELAEAWIQVTGCTHLSCTHCKGERSIVPYWINSIRKRCMKKTWAGAKGGLHKGTILPSTCDAQQARNSTCNPINNPTYSKLRSAKIDDADKKEAIKQREAGLQAIGLKTKSYRYTV